MLPWYRPYFEIAVQTGLRPFEQVALKWGAIFEEFIHNESSRVYGKEKSDLKTEERRRMIQIRPSIKKWLDRQREMTTAIESPYVFIFAKGRPILQDKLREVWARVIKKSGLSYSRMYETRHTFASWELASGEIPEWVARTLAHVDTSMVFRTYGRYIPNLTRRGMALNLRGTTGMLQMNKGNQISHNFSHNVTFQGCLLGLNHCFNKLFNWWRRGESNPRPETFRLGVYIHSPMFSIRPLVSYQATLPKG